MATGFPASLPDFRARHLQRERWFFGGMAVALAVTVLAGFAPTYYLKGWLGPAPTLSPLLHWHGIAFTAWMLLLITQTSLIAAGQRTLHRTLGFAGVGLVVLMMVLGASVAITLARQGVLGAATGIPPLIFLAVPLATIVVFPVLFGAAVHYRRRTDWHKRLMLLATVELVTAAVARLPFVSAWGPPGFFGVADLFVVAIVIYDLVTLRRVHPATVWGGLFLIASQPLRLVVAGTSAWQGFAGWLVG